MEASWPGLFAAVGKLLAQFPVEEDRFADGQAILVPPKQMASTPARQVMSAGAQLSAATALAKRAPSMHLEPVRLRDARDAAHLALVVERAEFGRLRQRDDLRARVVDVGAPRDDFSTPAEVSLPWRCGESSSLEPLEKNSGARIRRFRRARYRCR